MIEAIRERRVEVVEEIRDLTQKIEVASQALDEFEAKRFAKEQRLADIDEVISTLEAAFPDDLEAPESE